MQVAPQTVDVSVVIPLFNAGPLLSEQLAALSRQTFTGSWEVVIADNGSSDDSLTRAAEYAGLLPLVVADASSRRGPAHARNLGASVARGDWVAFCDADDVVADDWLAHLYAARSAADLIAGAIDIDVLNGADVVQARGGAALRDRLPDGPADFLPYVPSCNLLIRRDRLQEIGGWDEDLSHCEDVDLSWRAQLGGLTVAIAPDAVVHYRFRGSSSAAFQQTMRYKAAEVVLFDRYRTVGTKRRGPLAVARSLWWITSRALYPLLGSRRRYLWFTMAGAQVGCIHGSLRYHVVYL